MDKPLLLGLDIGGTKCAALIGDARARVYQRKSIPTPRGRWGEGVATLSQLLRDVCRDHGTDPAAAGALGVSFGGPWDGASGRTRTSPVLPAWRDVPLRDVLHVEFGIPIAIENDANATALAEHRWGAGRDCRDMAFMTMGTGIGCGPILGGEMYRGRSGLAGEIGHIVIEPDGPECACGKRGCLEALASGTAIGRMGRKRYDDPSIDAVAVCERARSGDSVAIGIVQDAARWMGIGIANLLHTLNLERIVLGTLAVEAGDLFLPPIRTFAEQACWPEVWQGTTIVAAGLGQENQDLAALAVAADEQRCI